MLDELVVEGLGVIDRAELTLGRGCISLTGETGAGKTLLVAAASLLAGGRADRSLVRAGAPEARVQGRFVLRGGHPAVALLRAQGVVDGADEDEVEVVVARTVPGDGRAGKARINGRLVTVALLGELGPLLVEIAGQHAHQRIGSSRFQRHLLDSFVGDDAVDLAAEVAAAVRASVAAGRRAAELRAAERDRSRELDVLDYEIAEIEAVGVVEGEAERLNADARRLEHAEAIATGLDAASSALRADGGAEESLESARRRIDELLAVDDSLQELATRLNHAALEVGDLADELARRNVAIDPDALEATRGRLAEIAKLKRKYGDDEVQILAYLGRARTRVAELQLADADLEAALAAASEARDHALAVAARLSELRAAAAPRLEVEVAELLEKLALPGARLEVQLESCELYEGGGETVEFLVTVNPGEPARPINKVASGGELSRIALVLHLLTSSETAQTMVFDEVDAGVGGEAAQSVGRALADLARRSENQVVVVTHLPQVAAFADSQYRVTKDVFDGRTVTTIEEVSGDERVAELSRMLAGLRSERARQHARELLEMASSSDAGAA